MGQNVVQKYRIEFVRDAVKLTGQSSKYVKTMIVRALTTQSIEGFLNYCTHIYIDVTECRAEEYHSYLQRCGQTKRSKLVTNVCLGSNFTMDRWILPG